MNYGVLAILIAVAAFDMATPAVAQTVTRNPAERRLSGDRAGRRRQYDERQRTRRGLRFVGREHHERGGRGNGGGTTASPCPGMMPESTISGAGRAHGSMSGSGEANGSGNGTSTGAASGG